jgi:hypothetical protein
MSAIPPLSGISRHSAKRPKTMRVTATGLCDPRSIVKNIKRVMAAEFVCLSTTVVTNGITALTNAFTGLLFIVGGIVTLYGL